MPTIKGTSVEAELHGNVIPPQVSAIAVDVELPMKMRLPLIIRNLALHQNRRVREAVAYIQSILESFSQRVPGGVLKLTNARTRIAARPEIGKFISIGAFVSFRQPGILSNRQGEKYSQKNHRHCPSSARAPPTSGPMPAANVQTLRTMRFNEYFRTEHVHAYSPTKEL